MATATKPRKAATPAAPPSSTQRFQDALKDLDEARQRASGDARDAIDAATDRVREIAQDAADRAQQEVHDWQRALERAGDDVRQQLGVMAVRVQATPEALTAMAAEIRKRKAELTGQD
jgi:hypothetical protein